MPATIEEKITKFAETIWPEYEITVGPNQGGAQAGEVPPGVGSCAVNVHDRDGHFVDKVTAETMEKLHELIEQKLNKG